MYRIMQESKCYSRRCEYCSDQDQYFSCSHKSPYCCCFVISRQESWSGLPFPSPGDSDPGIETHVSCIGQGVYLPLSHLGSPQTHVLFYTLHIVVTGPVHLLYSQSSDSEEKTGFDTGYCNQ